MKPNIVDIELTIHYNINGDGIELVQGTTDTSTFDFHILDKDQDERTGRTTISFNSSNDLINIINDFNKRFNTIKKI